MSHRWQDVLDDQLSLFRFTQSEFGKVFHEGFAKSFGIALAKPDDQITAEALERLERTKRGRSWLEENLPAYVELMAWHGDPVYVDPDMMTLVEAASKSFEPEPLQPEDLIVPSGFLALPRPWYTEDRNGKRISIRYFAWMPVVTAGKPVPVEVIDGSVDSASGVVLAMFSNSDDPDDFFPEGQPRDEAVAKYGANILLSHLTPWPFGSDYPDNGGLYDIAKFVQCMWRLMAQTITVREAHRAERSTRRRLAKLKFPDKSVTVIRLRRPKADPDPDREPTHVDWQYRWIVSGHWRLQWYASLGIHRQIWISPFVKGPADKELMVRKLRVFEFVR